jgi:hypothetical protein
MKEISIKPIPIKFVAYKILLIRGQKVMLDVDLAEFYGVPVKRLNEQVKRNINRFPSDFMFQLSKEEAEQLNWSQRVTTSDNLKSQFATSSLEPKDSMNKDDLKYQIGTSSWGGKRKLPYAFTEHGVVMLASILRSQTAAEISIFIVRAFVRIREILSSNKELAAKIQELEREQKIQNKHINAIYSMFDKLLDKPFKLAGPIGFSPRKD